MKAILAVAAVLLLAWTAASYAQVPDPMKEITCEIKRDADGSIHRSAAVKAAFKRIHPCPVTGRSTGACPGWADDHRLPLAVNGCDAVWNMQWLPVQIKSCAADYCKDRFERKIYATPMQVIPPIK